MTKIRNTKKGMAKKTLSISLAVAMLATSNVPVWAAEDLFTDGAAAVETVEAPVEDLFSDAAEEVVEEAPVVEETVEAPVARDVDSDVEINRKNYTVSDVKIGAVGEWGTAVGVSGSIKDGATEVTGLHYTWMADGVEAAGPGASDAVDYWDGTVNDITYTPVKADYGKELSLRIYETGKHGEPIFSMTITGGVVQAQDISSYFKTVPVLEGGNALVFNGAEQKPTITNKAAYSIGVPDGKGGWLTITSDHFAWHYENPSRDLTNVTGEDIDVYGTLTRTDDPTSPSYGYTATTGKETYQITKLPVDNTNFAPALKTTSVEYNGTTHTFGKKDLTLNVMVGGKAIDITDALRDDYKVDGTGVAVGTGYAVTGITPVWADTDAADKILRNFEFNAANDTTENTYAIVKRNLSTCTATAVRDFNIDEFKGLDKYTVNPADIVLTGKDGRQFSLASIAGDVVVQVNKQVFDAANADRKGLVTNAFTISYASDSTNVEGTVNCNITLTINSLGEISVTYNGNPGQAFVVIDGVPYINVNYTGKPHVIDDKEGALQNLVVSNAKTSEYTVSYDDNVNAGVVEVTITGKESFAGSVRKVYFKIDQDFVYANEFSVKDTVTVNPANNYDASLYKDALGLKFETTLADYTTKVALTEGKDYTVKYYFVDKDKNNDGIEEISINSVADIKANAGTNVPGNYVYAVATPVKDGNFNANGAEIFDFAEISRKSISDVTVTVEKPSYVFTGKEIAPKVTVKDGSSTLEKGVDYTLKFKDNINVGTATVTVIPTATSDYDPETVATQTFEITPAKAEDVVVTFTEKEFKYTGKQIKPVIKDVKLNGVDVTKYFDITYPVYGENVNAGKDMGSVIVSPIKTTKNFTGTKTQLFSIRGKELKGTLKAYYGDKKVVYVDPETKTAFNKNGFPYSFYYDGEAQTFADYRFNPAALTDVTEGTDYEVKYLENVDAGTGFLAVVAKGNYEGNISVKLAENIFDGYYGADYELVDGKLYKDNKVIENNIVDIIRFNIAPSMFTARNIHVNNGTYAAGKPVKPEVSVVVNGRTLEEGKDYSLYLTDIDHESTPDTFVDVTTDKPYYVEVIPMGGYEFDAIYGSNVFIWGIDKKDLADCDVTVTKNGNDFDLEVMNGNVVELKEEFDVTDNGDGTATVSVIDGGKSYTGSATVAIVDPEDKGAVGNVEIADVKVDGNKVTVILDGEAENAEGYDYVISTEDNFDKAGRVDVSKNQLRTSTNFFYVQKGTYYAYAHAYRRNPETGIKEFSPEFSKTYKFTVSAITPNKPVITKVTRKGNDVTVTYTAAANATGYDVVLGTEAAKINGENRPVKYGDLVKKNLKEGTTSVTFKDVPAGTYYAGLHAFNRSRQDNNDKVFSPWSNIEKITVK